MVRSVWQNGTLYLHDMKKQGKERRACERQHLKREKRGYGGGAEVLWDGILGVHCCVFRVGDLRGDDVGVDVGTHVVGHHGPRSAHQVRKP